VQINPYIVLGSAIVGFLLGMTGAGVLVGSLISSRAPDRFVRPIITFVIFASGLKYVGGSTTALGWTLCLILLAAAVAWLCYVRPWENGGPLGLPTSDEDRPIESRAPMVYLRRRGHPPERPNRGPRA
jgi:hypothetical protein